MIKLCPECKKEYEAKTESSKICYSCFKKLNNLREIARNEVVLDYDDRVQGFRVLIQLGLLFSIDGYCLEVWKAEGQKSYHLHIKNIPNIANLPKEQNKQYKELLIKKYVKELEGYGYPAPVIDYSLCVPEHLVAEENKPHFKYATLKTLIGVINEGYDNFVDVELYSLATQSKQEYKPTIKGSGITAKITAAISIKDIAKQFGLSIANNKTLCPFHSDNLTPSLVFYEQQGRFYCFGCRQGGNIIKFYAMLKQLNPNFVYHKQENAKPN